MKNLFVLVFFACLSAVVFAQDLHPVVWEFEAVSNEDQVSTKLIFNAKIEDGWYLYAQELPEGGPIPTHFYFDEVAGIEFSEFCKETSDFLVEKYDEMFAMNLRKFKHEVSFTQEILNPSNQENITGYLEFMCCDDTQCLAPEIVTFNFKIK